MEKEFKCKKCGRIEKGVENARCCGERMEDLPLKTCTSAPSSAEHARPMDEEEPCDENRAG